MNHVSILGRVTRAPEKRTTDSGAEVTDFSIAWNRTVRGEREAHFFDCVAWNSGNFKLADYAAELKKGNRVIVQGELRMREFTPSGDDRKRRVHEIVLDKPPENLDREPAANGNGASTVPEPAGNTAAQTVQEQEAVTSSRPRGRAKAHARS
jgi:single-strand DNA-binding protein